MLSKTIIGFVLLSIVLICSRAEDGEGNPHFQIDHKSGKLDIMATRSSADIQSTEDYVDLVMKPGEGLSSVSHKDEGSQQRHNTPDQSMHRKSQKNGWREGAEEADQSSNAESRDSEKEDKLNNFDDKWQSLFKLPKGNKTVDSNVRQNMTNSNGTKDTKELETGKMIELETNAKALAQMISDSSSKGDLSPVKIKDAAKKLEEQIQNLQNDVLQNFVNNSGATKKYEELRNDEKERAKNGSSSTESKEGKINYKKENFEIKNKPCSNCEQTSFSKPENGIDSMIASKASNERPWSATSSGSAIKDVDKDLKDESKPKERKGMDGKKDEKKEWKTSENQDINIYEKEGGVQGENREGKRNESSSKITKGPKNKFGKEKEGAKVSKNCGDCGTKIPKVGDKEEDGKLAVPKLNEDNETTNGFKDNATSQGKEGTSIQGEKIDIEKANASLEENKEKESKKSKGRVAAKFLNEDDSNGANTPEKNKGKKKPCKNCQGKIPKPGNKTDDGKLIVPKLSKNPNKTKETSDEFYQSALTNETVLPGISKEEKYESFDLDDDSQVITEDADYADLSNDISEPSNKTSEATKAREEVETSQMEGNKGNTTANGSFQDGTLKGANSRDNEKKQSAMNIQGKETPVTDADDADLSNDISETSNKTSEATKAREEVETAQMEGNKGNTTANESFEDGTLKGANSRDNEKKQSAMNIQGNETQVTGAEDDKSKVLQGKSDSKDSETVEDSKEKTGEKNIEKDKKGSQGSELEVKKISDSESKVEEKGNKNENKEETNDKLKNVEKDGQIEAGKIIGDETKGTTNDAVQRKVEENPEGGIVAKFSAKSFAEKRKQNSRNEDVKLQTVKQFDDLLDNFLSNATTEKRKQLLKLTWHDIRERYSNEKNVKRKQEQIEKDGKNSIKNNTVNNSGPKTEPKGAVKDAGRAPTLLKIGQQTNENAAQKIEKNARQETDERKNFKNIVGRIKEKISLLKDLIEYNKIKEMKKLKKSTKIDPYVGFKREKINN